VLFDESFLARVLDEWLDFRVVYEFTADEELLVSLARSEQVSIALRLEGLLYFSFRGHLLLQLPVFHFAHQLLVILLQLLFLVASSEVILELHFL